MDTGVKQLLQGDQQVHSLRQNDNNVLVHVHPLLHVSDLTGRPAGSAQLRRTVMQPFCRFQYVELLQFLQCMSVGMDMWIVIGAACRLGCVYGVID